MNNNMFENLWVEKYRPKNLQDIILSTENREYFESIKEKQEIPHLLLAGAPGQGKSSVSFILVKDILQCSYRYINASDKNGIDTIRNEVMGFAETKSFDGKVKCFILDECDFLTDSGQAALRNVMEEYSENIRFILTCNYLNKIIKPIQSRCQYIDLLPPRKESLLRVFQILQKENIKISSEVLEPIKKLLLSFYPDIRKMINYVQQHSITGELKLYSNNIKLDFTNNLLKRLQDKENIIDLRRIVIENGIEYENDFNGLLKSFFETVYNSSISVNIKKDILVKIGETMFKNQSVMDQEINFYCMLIEVSKML